jgi:hypothetical protein
MKPTSLSTTIFAVTAAALTVTGCSIGFGIGSHSECKSQPECAPAAGLAGSPHMSLPPSARIVAAGYVIDWRPPTSETGTAVLYDRISGRAITSKRVSETAAFEFNATEPDSQVFLRKIDGGGIDGNISRPSYSKMDFVLYFIPDHPVPPTEPMPR